jgi:hypothetical protein
MNETKKNLPAIQDLYGDIEKSSGQNALNVLLNQPPTEKWLKPHPTAKKKVDGKDVPITYIPIERVEYLLTRIFIKWRVEIKDVKLIANSVIVTVRLYYQDPLTGEWDYQDGVGANPLQTDKDAGATNFDRIKSHAVMIAAPAAESYAVKDAAEKIGKLFGKDLNRADQIGYDSLITIFDGNENIVARKRLEKALDECQDNDLKQTIIADCIEAVESGLDTVEFYTQQLHKIQPNG